MLVTQDVSTQNLIKCQCCASEVAKRSVTVCLNSFNATLRASFTELFKTDLKYKVSLVFTLKLVQCMLDSFTKVTTDLF